MAKFFSVQLTPTQTGANVSPYINTDWDPAFDGLSSKRDLWNSWGSSKIASNTHLGQRVLAILTISWDQGSQSAVFG